MFVNLVIILYKNVKVKTYCCITEFVRGCINLLWDDFYCDPHYTENRIKIEQVVLKINGNISLHKHRLTPNACTFSVPYGGYIVIRIIFMC